MGLTRKRQLYSLYEKDDIKAILVANISDIGLNLSDLTNCIQIFIIDTNSDCNEILDKAFSQLSCLYEKKEIPVLLYPSNYAKEKSIPYEKIYELTVLDLENISPYLQFIYSLTKRSNSKISKLS